MAKHVVKGTAYAILTVFVLLWLCRSWATQVQASYSQFVESVTQGSKVNYDHPVYILPWVKVPGAYPFSKGMTVADLVALAGGLAKDEKIKPGWVVHNINVLRPSSDNPDPIRAIYCFPVDWTKPESNVSECKFELHERDVVLAIMGTCLTNGVSQAQPAGAARGV